MDYLKDDNLKAIDYIKEIDTLAIVEKASKIKEKRKNKLLVICFALMILFGANNLVKFGMKIYIFVLLVLSVVLIEKREGNLC